MGATVRSVDDDYLIALIHATTRNLIFIGPGISQSVAEAISSRWEVMGRDSVQVLLDVDPEICRLGYGTIDGLQLLQKAAGRVGATINHRPGIRIGMLVSDATTLVFSPTPLLVEGASTQFPRPNAIQLDFGSESPPDLHGNVLSPAQDLLQAGERVSSARVEEVAKDLSANPPQKFDLARTVRVFNALFEFVEFELKGFSISRKTVPISSDLMGLADSKTQKLFRSTFRLVGEDSEISGVRVAKLKEWIVKRYLIVLPGYGTVLLRSKKAGFEAAVTALRHYVSRFQKRVHKKLEAEMEINRSDLLGALIPAVSKKPPARWKRDLGPQPSEEDVRALLDTELKSAFGSVADIFQEMKVNVAYKGVTYELLMDPDFIKKAQAKMPGLKVLHEEFDAAQASEPGRRLSFS
ncbi:MAG TPA: hypothetical protein VFB23_09790 [Candidatus Acidoferrales bacterium]|nr:hypothetical protein [Candidatus Acidoferrales bacterium]